MARSAMASSRLGDHFFYYAPDGRVPQREQPYATIVTKDYPGDALSNLDPAGRWRLNIHVGRGALIQLTGEDPESVPWDYAATDIVLPHPVYRAQGWVAIVNPGAGTHAQALRWVQAAHEDAKRRAHPRRGPQEGD